MVKRTAVTVVPLTTETEVCAGLFVNVAVLPVPGGEADQLPVLVQVLSLPRPVHVALAALARPEKIPARDSAKTVRRADTMREFTLKSYSNHSFTAINTSGDAKKAGAA